MCYYDRSFWLIIYYITTPTVYTVHCKPLQQVHEQKCLAASIHRTKLYLFGRSTKSSPTKNLGKPCKYLARIWNTCFSCFLIFWFFDTKHCILQSHSYTVTIAHSVIAQLSAIFIISYTFLRQAATKITCPERRLVGSHNVFRTSNLSCRLPQKWIANYKFSAQLCYNGMCNCNCVTMALSNTMLSNRKSKNQRTWKNVFQILAKSCQVFLCRFCIVNTWVKIYS